MTLKFRQGTNTIISSLKKCNIYSVLRFQSYNSLVNIRTCKNARLSLVLLMNRLRGLGSCLPVSLFCHITCICPFFALHFVCQQNTFIINEGRWSSDGLKLQYWALNTLSLLFFNIKGSLLLILLIVFVVLTSLIPLFSPSFAVPKVKSYFSLY